MLIVGESVSGKKEGKLKRSAQSESMDSERSAMSTSSSSFGMPESKTADNLDRQIEGLLRDWHHNPDMLFSVHPVDGSFLVWSVPACTILQLRCSGLYDCQYGPFVKKLCMLQVM